ncbi:hypothetical protein AVEN_151121-1 [Araneus ventricosus]|uniref:Uncharacterized protein n=1 Tax=Araneus ventricosus TaxID=182803 RepID=A0A4Y2K6F3_ARAVE|nr:hypothetical protein AVEN_151121-1 [Araneus ventricosus]
MLKTNAELRCLNEDSTEVYMKDLFEKYSTRPGTLEDICLAQFVFEYVPIRSKMQFNEDSFNLEKLEYRRKKKSSVISEYQEVEIVNREEMYNECLDRIEENRRLFSAIADEVLEEALENAQQEVIEIEEEEAQDFIMEKVSQHQNVDILQQGGQEIAVNKTVNRYICPKRISQENICSSISRLNEGQKDFVLHILNSFKLKKHTF